MYVPSPSSDVPAEFTFNFCVLVRLVVLAVAIVPVVKAPVLAELAPIGVPSIAPPFISTLLEVNAVAVIVLFVNVCARVSKTTLPLALGKVIVLSAVGLVTANTVS